MAAHRNATTTRPALTERVGDEIRLALTRQRMSQAGLARRLGVSQSWLSYRLTGVQAIDLNDLQEITEALGVPLAGILAGALRLSAGALGAAVQQGFDELLVEVQRFLDRRDVPEDPKEFILMAIRGLLNIHIEAIDGPPREPTHSERQRRRA